MSKKSFMKLFVAVLVVCLAACVFVACNKNKDDNSSNDYRPGDVVVSEKDVTWTVDTEGNVIMGEYQGKDIVVKYLLDNAAYLVMSGQEVDDMAITGYHGEIKSFSLKDIEDKTSVNGGRISVTSVKENTFFNCESLETVDLTKSSRALSFEVGANAFKYCTSLTKVTLPSNLYVNDNVIGASAFERCEALNDVTIGDSFTVINSHAFAFCTSLDSITLPAGIKNIAEYTFYGCEKLSKLSFTGETVVADIPEGAPSDTVDTIVQPVLALRTIGSYAFANTALTDGNFNKFTNLRVIGNNAFNNTAISEVVIPSNVSMIANGAFYDCLALTNVDIPFLGTTLVSQNNWNFNSVYGFDNPESLYQRELSVRVRGTAIIPSTAFAGSRDIKSINISYFNIENTPVVKVYGADGVSFTEEIVMTDSSIAERAFYNCSELTSLRLSENPQSIGERAFEGCEKLDTFPISNDLIEIGNRAFASCYELTGITVPSSVRYIGNGVFADCKALASIEIESFFFNYVSNYEIGDENIEEIVGYDKLANLSTYFATNTYLNIFEGEAEMYLTNGAGTHVYVPKALKSVKLGNMYYVPAYMFDGFSELTNIELTMKEAPAINDLVDGYLGTIGDYAFYNCSSLNNLTINDEDGVITSIGNNAFSGCENLGEFEISENVAAIGNYAFRNTGLTSFTIPATLPHNAIGTGILADCVKLASVEIKDYDFAKFNLDNGYYDYVSFGTLTRLFNGNTIFNIEDYITRDEYTGDIISNTFPLYKTSESWGVYVPYTLKTVKLGSVTVLSGSAFSGFSSLTTIEIEWADDLGNYNYNGVQSSEDLRPTIGSYAFANCTALNTLTFTGATVNSNRIQNGAFSNCESLTSLPVVLPVGFGLVNGCTSLTEITVDLPTTDYSWYLASLFNPSNTSYSNEILNTTYNKLTKVTLTSSQYGYIPANMLRGAENITEVVFTAEDIYAIGSNAFADTQLQTGSTDYLVTFNGWVLDIKSSTSFIVIPSTVKGIADSAVSSGVRHVFFDGTSEQWSNIRKGDLLNGYQSPTVYFYSAIEPAYIGNYWHYEGADKETIQVWGGDTFGVVTYDISYGNGTFDYIKVEASNPLTEADVNLPVIEGKVFAGWYADPDKTIAITFPYNGENGRSIYAAWRDLTLYTLVINEDLTLTAWGDGQLIESDLPNLAAYRVSVLGWYTDSEKTNSVSFPYSGADTTLYAEWETLPPYTIEYPNSYPFEYNGGVYTSTNVNVNNSNSSFTIVVNADVNVSFTCTVSSEANYDYVEIVRHNANSTTEMITSNTTLSGSKTEVFTLTLNAGDSLEISYIKDGSQSSGADTATISDLIIEEITE